MSFIEYSAVSCGLAQLVDLENECDPWKTLVNCFDYDIDTNEEEVGAFVLYSDANVNSNGQELTDYIRRYKLGPVAETNLKYNPNSGNQIRAWIWEPNWEALDAHFERHG